LRPGLTAHASAGSLAQTLGVAKNLPHRSTMPKTKPKTLQPRDFEVNRTWLAYRINQAPMQVEGAEIDLYILQDAASMFIFGNVFAEHGADYPKADDVEALLLSAHSQKDEWPDELLLPGAPAPENSFIKVAKEHGIQARTVPESQMSFYIKDTQEAYEEFLSRDSGDA
jgi:hypothetical protein